MEYKYALRYQHNLECRDEGYTRKDAEGGFGLTDCLLGISIILPPDGSYSQRTVVADNGKEKRSMNQQEVFKAWSLLGMSLHEEKMLKGWQAQIVEIHHKMMCDVMNNKK